MARRKWVLWVNGIGLWEISVDEPSGHGMAKLGGIRTGFHEDVGDAVAAEVGTTKD